jgi:hypothetical protein
MTQVFLILLFVVWAWTVFTIVKRIIARLLDEAQQKREHR